MDPLGERSGRASAPGEESPRGASTTVVAVSVAAALAAVLAAGLVLLVVDFGGPSATEQATDTARRYLAAWEKRDLAAMGALAQDPAGDLEDSYERFWEELAVEGARFELGPVRAEGDEGRAAFSAVVEVGGLDPWEYEGALAMAPSDEEDGPAWRVAWEPAAIHPDLGPGRRLARVRTWAPRAPILGAGGVPLTGTEAARLPALQSQILGRVGPLEADALADLGDPYVAGDEGGTSGLQAAFETRLAGRPSGEVQIREGDRVVEVLRRFPGSAPQSVQSSLDAGIQQAAEGAMARTSQPAALVAVTASTGEVRAAVSRPVSGYNRAFTGQYPPGSTFKVVTTSALLGAGTTPDTTTTCPPQANIGGFSFSNAEEQALGTIPFRTAFFKSCNTAFVQLASKLDPSALVQAAERFGFNRELDLPLPASGGSFPVPSGEVDQAAAAIGQGRVTASPLQMATVAATVASGTYRSPQVVVPGTQGQPGPLDPGVAETLRGLMRLVVQQGTGTNAQLPGTPVAGKTGTAEFGTRRPPRTHAWFIGFRGDLALAVLVEDGGFGGAVAAPLARDFLARLP